MSKKFKRQDYFRYKRLGKKWRRPVGWQSKLRLKKAGAGLLVSVGYGSPGKMQPVLVHSEKDFANDCSAGIIISSRVGSRKAKLLSEKAKELGIRIANMKKVKRAARITKTLEKKKHEHKKKHEKKTQEKHDAKEIKEEAKLIAEETLKEEIKKEAKSKKEEEKFEKKAEEIIEKAEEGKN